MNELSLESKAYGNKVLVLPKPASQSVDEYGFPDGDPDPASVRVTVATGGGTKVAAWLTIQQLDDFIVLLTYAKKVAKEEI